MLTRTILVACAAALGLGLTYAVDDRAAAVAAPSACTAKQKKQRQLAVTSYKKRMPKDRAAYYRKHTSRKLRAAFVKKQQARLKALQKSLAACNKKPTTTTPSTTTTSTPTTTSTTTTTTVPALQTDLGISMRATVVDRRIVYTLAVRNISAVAANGVKVRDALPSLLGLISVSSIQGSCSGTTLVTCDLGTVAAGATAEVTLVTRLLQRGTVTNEASVSTSSDEVAVSNNAVQITGVFAAADLSVTKVASVNDVVTGASLTYTITIRNLGDAFAQDVTLSDALPPGLELVSSSSTRFPCLGTIVLTCGASSIAPGDAFTVTITSRATQPGTITNTAVATTSALEVDDANNAATATTTSTPAPPPAPPQPYTFFPQAGIVGQDLFINNFVDLDPSSGVQDWSCRGYSYNTHRGLDVDINSFREQEVGVPVFAALDGTVVAAHDSEPDMNTTAPPVPDNHVILDHDNSQQTVYVHLKRNSVGVSVGQHVAAGTQIGSTASSGSSTWPHLHFESHRQGTVYEPFAGPCRPGASGWLHQPSIRDDVYARDVTVSPNPFTGQAALPWDQAVRTGTFVTGMRTMHFRVQLANLPANSTRRTRVIRPNGSAATDFSEPFGNSAAIRWGWWAFALPVDLNATGPWRILFDVNGTTVADAPVTAVGTPAQVVNRPPQPISVGFDTPPSGSNVPVCRAQASLVTEDPDYDLVRFRYRWSVGATVVRDVTSAARSDALPKGAAGAGATLTCSVTPSDGLLNGPEASVSVTVTA